MDFDAGWFRDRAFGAQEFFFSFRETVLLRRLSFTFRDTAFGSCSFHSRTLKDACAKADVSAHMIRSVVQDTLRVLSGASTNDKGRDRSFASRRSALGSKENDEKSSGYFPLRAIQSRNQDCRVGVPRTQARRSGGHEALYVQGYGIDDPKRICIVGASYGGYMALAGATFSPDLYACAVSYAGLSDLARALYTGTTFESEAVSGWKRRTGADLDSSKLDTQSPAKYADRVKSPVLLIHGDKDTTVPIGQSEVEQRALERAGRPVSLIRLDGDDHYLEFSKTRTQLLTSIEAFLAAHIGS